MECLKFVLNCSLQPYTNHKNHTYIIFASFKCQNRKKSKIENSISNKNSKTSKYKTSKDWRGKSENTQYIMTQKILSSKFNNIVNGVVN